jgi:hypothetical protein
LWVNLINILVATEHDHDVDLFELDIGGVVVLAEKDFNVALEDARTLLADYLDVAEGDILDLGLGREESDHGRGQLLEIGLERGGGGFE